MEINNDIKNLLSGIGRAQSLGKFRLDESEQLAPVVRRVVNDHNLQTSDTPPAPPSTPTPSEQQPAERPRSQPLPTPPEPPATPMFQPMKPLPQVPEPPVTPTFQPMKPSPQIPTLQNSIDAISLPIQ